MSDKDAVEVLREFADAFTKLDNFGNQTITKPFRDALESVLDELEQLRLMVAKSRIEFIRDGATYAITPKKDLYRFGRFDGVAGRFVEIGIFNSVLEAFAALKENK